MMSDCAANPLGGSVGMPPPTRKFRIFSVCKPHSEVILASLQELILRYCFIHTLTCNFPSCHTTFLYVVKYNFVYTIDQVFKCFAFLPVPPIIIIITYLSVELEERPPHWSSRASIIRCMNIIEDKQVVT